MSTKAKAGANFGAKMKGKSGLALGVSPKNFYKFECHRMIDGVRNLVWSEKVPNLVTTQGKNDTLDKYFKGSSYTAAWFVGLVDNAGFSAFNAADTAAQINGSNGWDEADDYSEANRQTLTLGSPSAGAVDNSGAPAVFSINATVTIHGAFLVSNNTKNGTSGVLYGEAAFSSDRSMLNGDELTVTVTLTQT